MNKRIISALVLAGMIASTSAFASRARELVMGQGGADVVSGRGSFYYDDAYNFFYNPAYVNDYKNWVIVEKDAVNAASMGFVTSMSNFNMGLFFNREDSTQDPYVGNGVDLLIGGDTGVKWGLLLNYAGKSPTAPVAIGSANEMNARFGISMNGLDPYVSYRVLGKAKDGAGNEVGSYKGFGAGLRYHYGEWTPYAAYNKNKNSTARSNDDVILAGLGRETKLAEGTRLVYALYWANTKNTAAGVQVKSNVIPMQVGVEADALSWLTLRAGFSHTLIASTAKSKSTRGRVGGTFHVSKVDLDYAFGTGNTVAGNTADSSDIGFDSGTFHTVGMRYSW